jgi:hypothetical protein
MSINLATYRRHETTDGNREYIGYDSTLIEDLVREHNDLELRIQQLEARLPKTPTKRKQNVIRIKEVI